MSTVVSETSIKVTEKYDIKSFEVNANNELKPFVLLQHLEDAAYVHAEKYGFGYSATYPNGYGWFVIKYHIKLNKLPRAWEKISITTWPCLSKGIQCRRDFEIYDENNAKIGKVASSWALIDLGAKRIVNPFKTLNFPELKEEYALSTDFAKFEPVQNACYEKLIDVRFDDLDLNKHVNNANYIAWATEAMPYEFLSENSISEIEIYYKKEAKYGMKILSQTEIQPDSNITLHTLKDSSTGEELALIRIHWHQ